MAIQFDKLKQVDQETRDLVTGFIKMFETELDEHCIIPSLVVTTCILFYHLGEMFTVYGEHMDVELDEACTGLRIFDIHITRETAYGNIRINNKYKCIYAWDIELTYTAKYDTFIGIDSSNKEFVDSGFFREIENTYYAFSPSALKTSSVEHQVIKPFGKKMKQGDIVRMEINTNDRTMKVYVNGEDLGIAHDNIVFDEKVYYLAVSMRTDAMYIPNILKLVCFEILSC